ncbi:hypothetical protein DPMN_061400 [Dreissena polymorpha]|uniref:Uncharacterized protein n=1 Tax=Dreissena polymorpha TaxID=45954 RepID=A0A9D4HID2_DREPO|nr:hypothetical protein DPMN_061400 [Dreissena polymorpha]
MGSAGSVSSEFNDVKTTESRQNQHQVYSSAKRTYSDTGRLVAKYKQMKTYFEEGRSQMIDEIKSFV